ncbi:chemotaxis protein CheA (plasmid) [Hafnia alvei]|jgi:two-component system chemotaxis sensor kinase CheA|uniref:chemotaxis protein CheA n=1 Tax=Hafnia alvei TaxID=569 RepID=UPI0028BEEBD9|nr:chemotaxis protein CheA [Hafnia alvei]WNN54726.1 chemotaxis protein CheA [Hafnia alvei]
MDFSDFYQTFFEEADELLADMEKHLLELDYVSPDTESLNAIFRAAHSIKGGAGTFGFSVLQDTTHILENLLDDARCGELQLTSGIIDLFLESKDIMQDQLDAYKSSQEPDQESFNYICTALRQMAEEAKLHSDAATSEKLSQSTEENGPADTRPIETTTKGMRVIAVELRNVKEAERQPLLDELGLMGTVSNPQQDAERLTLELTTRESEQDIEAVLCFLLDSSQITLKPLEKSVAPVVENIPTVTEAKPPAAPATPPAAPRKARTPSRSQSSESSSIRVAVEKVDQIINLVGELIISQAMLTQLSSVLDPAIHDDLISSIAQLERNARDLQESVMSTRMMPMEYVFSRFPRLVHDLAAKLNKQVELTLIGGSAELDKSLIERIIDPLTHLVRNSLDHGIESMEVRRANGKPEQGRLTLSAEHHGGNIVIEVIDDGAGLNREKILARAHSQGLQISDSMADEDVWMLIFAAGFSTAEKVTDVSGRGVGMDVVRRNIHDMGGHVEIHSEQGKGSRILIILPLTLAILDGMSIRAGNEIYVLPLNTVMESLLVNDKSLYTMAGGERVLQVREEYLPLIELHKVFDIPKQPDDINEGIAVIVQSAGNRYALLVDQLIGQHQVVVKNMEHNYRKVPGVSAATILGDGSVALILDVAVLTSLSKNK